MRGRTPAAWIAAAMLLAAPLTSPREASAAPADITAIRVAGNQHVPAETILRAARGVAKERDRVDDIAPVRDAMQREIMRLGYFQDVRVTGAPEAGGVALTITVRERTRVTRVAFSGAEAFSSEDLLRMTRTRPGLFLDARLVERDAERISETYREHGILGRVVHVDADERGEVTFHIQEVRAAAVRFQGLRAVAEAEALERFALPPGTIITDEAVNAAIQRLDDTGWFARVEVSLGRDEALGDAAAFVIVSVLERAGPAAERIGAPRPAPDPARLRADVGIIRLDMQYLASVNVNDFLLEMDDDAQATFERLREEAAGDDASPGALMQYARVLRAVGRDTEAVLQVVRATMRLRALLDQQPDDPDLLLSLGEALSIIGEHADAVATLRKAAQLAPGRWEPRVEFARAAGEHLRAEFGKALAARDEAEAPTPLSRMTSLRAIMETMPWENTRRVMLEALNGQAEPDEAVLLGREAAAHLAEALRLAPDEPAVLRACFSTMLGTVFTTLGVIGHMPAVWQAVDEDAAGFIEGRGDLVDADPGLALWSTFFASFRGVLTLAGHPASEASEEQIIAELRRLAQNLTVITARWPRALRTSGSMLGILQFLAGEHDMARATFEDSVRQNPYDRQNYTVLLGLAFDAEDWEEMERIVRRRMAVLPAAEDHVLLGKIAERRAQTDDIEAHFRDAVAHFPGAAVGYAALAGRLVHTGADDAEAEALLDRALALDPHHAYAHAVRAALCLLQDKPDEAVAALKAALRAQPDEELALLLRERYFEIQQGG